MHSIFTANLRRLGVSPDQTILAAVSGGVDSVVLGELLFQAKQPFAVAHVNFSLRGTESDADEAFARTLAQRWNVPFHAHTVDTNAEATNRQLSVQVAARELRYKWFADLLSGHNYDLLATAHHATDNIETALLNLARGTGLAGLRGIPEQNERTIRPLLGLSRAEIEAFALAEDLTWREDGSNQSDHYARNKVRHHVLPTLRELNPSLEATFSRTARRLSEQELVWNTWLRDNLREVLMPYGDLACLPLSRLAGCQAPFALLESWMSSLSFSVDQTEQLIEGLERQEAREFQSQSHRLTQSQGWLIAEPLSAPILPSFEITPDTHRVRTQGLHVRLNLLTESEQLPASGNEAMLCAQQLEWPLQLRPMRTGDRVEPLGLGGSRLVSDLLAEAQIPVPLRSRTYVLESGGRIAWVLGHRIGHPFRITEKTTTRLHLHYEFS